MITAVSRWPAQSRDRQARGGRSPAASVVHAPASL